MTDKCTPDKHAWFAINWLGDACCIFCGEWDGDTKDYIDPDSVSDALMLTTNPTWAALMDAARTARAARQKVA